MPNIAKVIKEEITRLAKKETKIAIAGIRRDNIKLKKTAANLKRRITRLEHDNKRLISAEIRRQDIQPAIVPGKAEKVRITSRGIKALRKKLNLSQDKFAILLGATPQSVWMWENKGGALRLRDNTKAAVLSVR